MNNQPEVLVNGRFLQRRVTGVERYAAETLRGLGERVSIIRPSGRLAGGRGHAWEQLGLPLRLPKQAVLWSPANSGPVLVGRQVLSLHDLSVLEHPEWFKPAFGLWYRLFLPPLVKRVRRVVTPSNFVRSRVMARFGLPPERVVTVNGGVDHSRFHPLNGQRQEKCSLLFVGSLEPRKNLPVLINAWNKIKGRFPDFCLVIAGARGPVFRAQHLPKPTDQLRFTGYVPDEGLPALMAEAALLVLPSLDEGFGLPVLEAMACGTPVIASDRGALPEVVGDAGLLFDPTNEAGLAALLERCLADNDLLRQLSEKGLQRAAQYSWQDSAEKLWNVLTEAYGG